MTTTVDRPQGDIGQGSGPAVLLALITFLSMLVAGAQEPVAPAKDSVADLLKGLDSALSAPPPAVAPLPAHPRLKCLENLHGKLELSSTYYWVEAEPPGNQWDYQDWLGASRLTLSTSQPVVGWNLATNVWLEAGNQESTVAGVSEWPQDDDRRRRYIEINELYATHAFGDTDLTLGRKLLPNGVSTFWSPASRYDAWDLNDPINHRSLGTWQARIDHYIGDTTLTAALLPVYQVHKFPAPSSRWYGSAFDYDFRYEATRLAGLVPGHDTEVPEDLAAWMSANGLPLNLLPTEPATGGLSAKRTVPSITWQSVGSLLRAKTTYQGFDLYSSFSYGYSPYPVLKISPATPAAILAQQQLELAVVPVRYASAAAGFSTTCGRWEFHGEAIQNQAEALRDDSYLNYVLGTTVSIDELAQASGCQSLNLVSEYFGERETQSQDAAGYIISSREVRLGRRDIATGAELKINEGWTVAAFAHHELGRQGRFYRLEVRKRLAPSLLLTGRGELFCGPDLSYYGLWQNNNRATVTLEYSF